MEDFTRKSELLLLVLASIFLIPFHIWGQIKHASDAVQPANQLKSTGKGGAMSEAFNKGKLPDPLRRPSGTVDEAAAALARQVSLRDESSVAALSAALLASGFALREPDGSVLQTVSPGQGLAFDAWEVAAMAKLYGEGRDVSVSELSAGLRSIPELKKTEVDAVLVNGIRKHAMSDNPLMRFYARFLVELGRRQEAPYDLLRAPDLKRVRLDAIQSALILRRLVGDFYALGRSGQQARAASIFPDPRDATFGSTTRIATSEVFVPIRWMSPRRYPFVGWEALQEVGCGSLGSGDAATILDGAATVITSGWGEILGLAPDGSGAAKYNRFLSIANVVLAYAKFIATYAALETTISVENPPLIRTKNSIPGDRRQLTAAVRMNTGGYDKINCFRTALNVATGLDMSLIKDGPLEGVEVNWHLDQGADYYSNSTGITGNRPIVGFAGNKTPRIQDAGTYAGISGGTGTAVGKLTRTKTDKEGKARVLLEGSPKVPSVADPLRTVTKHVGVYTTIKMKGGDLKGDATDVMGQAIGHLLGGVSGLVTMPLELLYRTDWASSGHLTVPVRDHERCTGEWIGTITYTETFKEEREFHDQNQTNRSTRDESYEAKIEMTGERENPHQRVAVGSATIVATATRNETRYGKGTSKALCNLENTMANNTTGSHNGRLSVGVMVNGDGTYSISKTLPTVSTSGEIIKSRKILECKNPFIKPSDSTSPIQWTVTPHAIDIDGKVDPKKPNEIKGSTTETFPEKYGTRTGTITWDLVRCGR